ncbi:MAG: 3'-5' exonuclease [Flavobacteriales bacterium]|nr:3'-5' exonuclease [Flavobacteriales bacterium]MBK6945535.1 3'-5' exonuclease [Flavobacteriales bacterium]MBK7241651.1 3'-5' exonuclease [Flavobacteriales bacterium]MBK7296358.1 3'-5' exonuclease [Flavobacteriales bacterium]MBK9534909.1 3'-5' exonuclease [Flavobacteriales bacterium]
MTTDLFGTPPPTKLTLERPLAVFDLETTGVRIGTDRIIQIGIMRLLPDGSREKYQTLVNPEMPIPTEATEVHGITDADVADSSTLKDLAPIIIEELAGCDLSGFNLLRFDVPFLAEELHRVGFEWDHASSRIVDVQRIYHKMEPRNLSAALKFYTGRDHEGAHDALADVEATADVLLAQLERYPDKLEGTIDFLGKLSGDRERSPDAAGKLTFNDKGAICLSFGKYKGWTLENIGKNDPGYMQWLMTKADLPASTLTIMKNTLEAIGS